MSEITIKRKANLLEEGWLWKDFGDGSGYLASPNNSIKFFEYDYCTQEYKLINNEWSFMNNYPYKTPWEQFKTEMERKIVEMGLSKYNETVMSIAEKEAELNIEMDKRLFRNGKFIGWKIYYELDKVEKALNDLLLAQKTPNEFDLAIIKKLCLGYTASTIVSMLTKEQKEIVVLGVECEKDCCGWVPNEVLSVYNTITHKQ